MTLTATTNEKGQLRFPVLAPGSYALTIELPPKFAPYREENITIGAGATLERTVVLSLAGVAETVVVEGTSRIEARSSGFETRFGQDYLTTIPTRRFSMFDLIKSAPGVSPTSPSSGTVNTVSVFGSGVNENLFLIDGTNFTCPCQGVSRAEPSVDVIQEVHVQSIGASVEYGNIQGAVFNVITKQGGDRFEYDASYYAQVSGLTAQPVVLPVRAGRSPRAGTNASSTATSRPTSAVQSRATGSGSSAATSTCATTTVSLARTRRFRESTSRTRSSGSSRGGLRRRCN